MFDQTVIWLQQMLENLSFWNFLIVLKIFVYCGMQDCKTLRLKSMGEYGVFFQKLWIMML